MHTFQIVGGILVLILVKKLFENRNAATANGKSDAASSSSATQGEDSSSSSFPSSGWNYEVFLSFRGEDTRTNFTDHLYNALVKSGIHTFRDNEGLRIGENINTALHSAIHQSKIVIPIFSKDYASSKWCLRELAEIVECMNQQSQRQITVMPVFYHVDPSEVRYQIGCYEKAFQKHQKKFGQETEGWKKALKQVADLKGWDLKNIANGHEGKLIQLIVKEVWSELRKSRSPLIVSDNLVGIHSHVEEMKKLLNIGSDDIRILGIHGLGGIGKTTIARCVYNTIYHHFEGCSFLLDARETFQTKGPIHLQCQLVINILNLENPNITSVDQGIDMIRQRLSNKKVLVVVDDVDQDIDLNVIIRKRDWFGIGSRIIITTRDRSILDVLGVDSTYEPSEMDSDHSLLLFSKHAFRRDQPPEQYLDLSKKVIEHAGGLPLALEVLGSFLVGKGESAWKDTVKKLKKIPNQKVLGKLRISYDGLDRVEKEMFLDIACFFIGMDKDIACYIWDGCDFFPEIGIEVLHQKSLVNIGRNNEIRMHDQLRDLGREIVFQENPTNPGERSRLWLKQEVLDVLKTSTGTSKVEGLCIDFKACGDGQCLMSEGFASLTKLRFLQVDYEKVAGNLVQSFSELRWLSWKGCPVQFTPTDLKKLVVLDLSNSDITENWMGWSHIKEAESLKIVNLGGCDKLSQTPDFSANLHLEILNFEECINLVTIDESIGYLKRLVLLNMNGCSSLRCLPTSISALSSLQTLAVGWCHNLQSLPELPSSLKSLYILNSGLKSLPRLSNLRNLEVLDLSSCENLVEIPITFNALTRLKSLSLRECHALEYIPVLPFGLTKFDADKNENLREISCFSNMRNLVKLRVNKCPCLDRIGSLEGLESLEELEVGWCKSMERLPDLSNLTKLRGLCLQYCEKLTEIHGVDRLEILKILGIYGCISIETLPCLSNLKNLEYLSVVDCKKLTEIQAVDELESLKVLHIDGCISIEALLFLSNLKNLHTLTAIDCEKLIEIRGVNKLESLKVLRIDGCISIEALPSLSNLKNLQTLSATNCKKLTQIQGVDNLESLNVMSIDGCISIETLPCLSKLKNLQDLTAVSCKKLIEIRGVDKLESLKVLRIDGCISIEALPSLSNLKNLQTLSATNCKKLTQIQGVDDLESLNVMCIDGCISIETLSCLSKLKSLHILTAIDCKKLIEIRGADKLESLKVLRIDGCISIEALPCLSKLKKLRTLTAIGCKKLTELQGVDELKSLNLLRID